MQDTRKREIRIKADSLRANCKVGRYGIIDLFKEGYDIATVAKMLYVNVNLLLIKTQEMNRLGMDFKLPYSPDATCRGSSRNSFAA